MAPAPRPPEELDRDFDALLDYLHGERGLDLSGYKRAGLMRRVRRRMRERGVAGFAAYRDRLRAEPGELPSLLDGLGVNVTGFFRDPAAWQALAREVAPRIAEGKRAGEPIRVWSAGCATGEEAYALVILLAEALGAERAGERVRVYATDREEAALARARSGVYTDREVEGVPAGLRERYFESGGGRHLFRGDLRRCLVFGRNDLSRDAPISGVDLLVCRNVLMYFQAEAQARILGRFHFALRDGGLLFLGSAEMLPAHAGPFRAVDLRARIFAKP